MHCGELRKSSGDLKKRQGCTYSGYTVFAGETVINTPDYCDTGYRVYIEANAHIIVLCAG